MEQKNLNVGVIGLGMGMSHAQGVKETEGACLYGLCDINEKRLKSCAKELDVKNIYTDYREMIADPLLDAVIIASPDQLHREMIVKTLEAGKHILCEKPLALTAQDCEAIVEAARKSSCKFMVGQICRYTPGFMQAKELIASGAIGDLTFVESEYAHDYTYMYKQGTWRSDSARNGVVGGGCHAVDLLRWIAGDPTEVMAYGTHKTFENITEYEDTHVAVMKFPDQVIGKVFVSISCKRDYTMRSVFYGTKGTIIVDNTSPTMTVFKEDVFPGSDHHSMPIHVPVDVNNHNAAGEFRDFYRTIMEDTPVKTSVYEGANTVAVCLAIVESAKSGQIVKPEYFVQ